MISELTALSDATADDIEEIGDKVTSNQDSITANKKGKSSFLNAKSHTLF